MYDHPRRLVPVSTLAVLVSCGGELENAEEAFRIPDDDASMATVQERCGEADADCLDTQGVGATSEQVEPVARVTLQPDYAEHSSSPQPVLFTFSAPPGAFELDELEAEVMMRVWVTCYVMSMTRSDPDRHEIHVERLTSDMVNATLGIDIESRTRELAALVLDMSGPERDAFLTEQIKDCVVDVVE